MCHCMRTNAPNLWTHVTIFADLFISWLLNPVLHGPIVGQHCGMTTFIIYQAPITQNTLSTPSIESLTSGKMPSVDVFGSCFFSKVDGFHWKHSWNVYLMWPHAFVKHSLFALTSSSGRSWIKMLANALFTKCLQASYTFNWNSESTICIFYWHIYHQ